MSVTFPSGALLVEARAALVGVVVSVAIGGPDRPRRDIPPSPGQIVGLTRKSVIIAPALAGGGWNVYRKSSYDLETGRARALWGAHYLSPGDLEKLQALLGVDGSSAWHRDGP